MDSNRLAEMLNQLTAMQAEVTPMAKKKIMDAKKGLSKKDKDKFMKTLEQDDDIKLVAGVAKKYGINVDNIINDFNS